MWVKEGAATTVALAVAVARLKPEPEAEASAAATAAAFSSLIRRWWSMNCAKYHTRGTAQVKRFEASKQWSCS